MASSPVMEIYLLRSFVPFAQHTKERYIALSAKEANAWQSKFKIETVGMLDNQHLIIHHPCDTARLHKNAYVTVGANFSTSYCKSEEKPSMTVRAFVTYCTKKTSKSTPGTVKIHPIPVEFNGTLINVKVVPQYPEKPKYIVVQREFNELFACKYLGDGQFGESKILSLGHKPLASGGAGISKKTHVWRKHILFVEGSHYIYICSLYDEEGKDNFSCKKFLPQSTVEEISIVKDTIYILTTNQVMKGSLNFAYDKFKNKEDYLQDSAAAEDVLEKFEKCKLQSTSGLYIVTATQKDVFVADTNSILRISPRGAFDKVTGTYKYSVVSSTTMNYLTPCYFNRRRLVMAGFTNHTVALLGVLDSGALSVIVKEYNIMSSATGRMFHMAYIEPLDNYLCIGENNFCHLIKLKLT